MAETDVIKQTPEVAPAPREKPFGPVAAAFLSAGIGAVALGILTTLAEASAGVKDALELNERVGPLSGKTVFAMVAWLVSWAILHPVLKDKNPAVKAVFTWTAIMFAVALVLTFPTFFLAFAPEE
jgi:hypothetical protein